MSVNTTIWIKAPECWRLCLHDCSSQAHLNADCSLVLSPLFTGAEDCFLSGNSSVTAAAAFRRFTETPQLDVCQRRNTNHRESTPPEDVLCVRLNFLNFFCLPSSANSVPPVQRKDKCGAEVRLLMISDRLRGGFFNMAGHESRVVRWPRTL